MLSYLKKIILSVAAISLFCSILIKCNESEDATASVAPDEGTTITRGLSAGDQNLDPNWDWTTDITYTVYASRAYGIQEYNVRLPYYSMEGPCAEDFNSTDPTARDMQSEYGWILLLKDFGTSTRAPKCPFFILYNIPRGMIRLYYYYPPDVPNYSCAKVTLSVSKGKTANLAFDDKDLAFLDEYDESHDMVSINRVESGQWCYADFAIGYDPAPAKDSVFKFSIIGVELSDVNLVGEAILPAEFLSNYGSLHTSFLSNIMGAGQTAKGYFKNTQAAIDWLNKHNGNQQDQPTTSGKSAITSRFVEYIPAIIAAAGFVTSLIQSLNSHSTPMDLAIPISLSGEITTSFDVMSFIMSVPGAARSTNDDSGPYKAINHDDKPLGVFALKTRPKTISVGITSACPSIYCSGGTVVTYVGMLETIQYELNQMSGYKVTSVKASYVYSKEAYIKAVPANFIDPEQLYWQSTRWGWPDTLMAVQDAGAPSDLSIAILLTVEKDQPVPNSTPVTIMKVYHPKWITNPVPTLYSLFKNPCEIPGQTVSCCN